MPDPFDEFPDASTALQDAQKRDAWNIFPDARDAFSRQKAQAAPGVYAAEGPVPSVDYSGIGGTGILKTTPSAIGTGFLQARLDIGSAIARALPIGATGDDFQHAAQDIDAERQAAGEGKVAGFVRGGARSLLPMALGSKLKVPGLPAATWPIAIGSAIQGSQSLTEARDQGLPEGQALAFAGRAAAVEAASELMFSRFFPTAEKVISGGVKPTIGTLRGFAGEIAKTAVSEYGQEAATEYLHSANEWLSNVNVGEHDWTREGFLTLVQRMNHAGMQGAFLGGGLGAANAGISAAERSNRFVDVTAERAARQQERAGRLAQLKQVRDANGSVLKREAEKVGITGTRSEIRKQLDREIRNAVQAPEVQQPEVPQAVQAQAPVEQAAEVPQVPVAPPTAPPPVDERQAILDTLGAADASLPEQPKQSAIDTHLENLGVKSPESRQNNLDAMKASIESAAKGGRLSVFAQPGQASEKDIAKFDAFRELAGQMGYEIGPQDYTTDKTTGYLSAPVKQVASPEKPSESQPKRDVAAEIRDALTQGHVTVTTSKVQSGFKVAKVNDDGTLTTKRGVKVPISEVMTINPPKPAEAPSKQQSTAVFEQPKTRMDLILDHVEKTGTEMTVRLEGATPEVLDRAIKEANKRGFWTTTDGNNLLIRPKELELPTNASDTETQAKIDEKVKTPTQPGKEVPNGQKQEEGQGRKGLLTPQTPQSEPTAAGEVPITTPAAPSVPPVSPPKKLGRKEQFAPEPTKPAAENPVEPAEFSLARGKKIEPSAPNPDLEKAGIKLKATPKGWSVTGISKEIADGLKADYQGTGNRGKGYGFRKDPTAGLIDASREIAAASKLDAAERAAGRVKTRVGYMEAEQGAAFNAEEEARLKETQDRLSNRANDEEQLLSQFVSKKNRGEWKLNMLRGREKGDSASIKGFDELLQYAQEHTELDVPRTEHGLFELLSKTKEQRASEDSQELDKVYADMRAEMDAANEASDFNFGANATEATEPKPAQAIIPGTEEAVASLERREEIKDARKAMAAQAKPKGKQTKFIRDQGDDLPGQKTAFATDAMEPESAADVNPLRSSLQQAADDSAQEVKDAEDDLRKLLKKKGSSPTAMLDPEIAAAATRVVVKYVKYGTLKFAAMIEQLAKSIGQAAVDRIRPALEAEWDRLQKTDLSMEQRTPETQAEPPPASGDDLTSIKKEVVNDLRELVGLPEMEGSTPQTVEEWAERARITLAADPKAGIRLVNELATNARPITQNDVMLLQFRYRQLANELAPVVDEYFAAVKSKDPVAIATSKTALISARKAMTDFEETIHPSKETWGRTGVALQQMLRKDFSIEAVLRRGQEANDGEELTPDQTAELTAMAKKFQDLQAQLEAQRKKTDELEAELASKRQHEEAVTEVKREKVNRKSDKRAAAEKKVADAWEKFRQAATSTAGSSGANLVGPAVDVAKAYIELGYVRFSEFMAAVKKNVPDADATLFRKAWDQAAGDAGVAVDKLDPNDKAELSKAAREIQRELVEAGMTDREQVIDAVHAALQEELPELTRRQAMDALSRYGIFQRQSQDEIEKLIRGMNSEILKLSQIDQMETAMKRVDALREQGKTDEEIGKALADEKLLVEATGLVRDRPSQTVRQLTQKYNELKKSIPATPANKAGMLQTTLNQMERALRNRISDLKFEIDRKEKVVKEKRDRPTSDTVKALQAERDALVAIHKDMFPAKKPSEAQRIASAIRGSDKAIAALEKQIASQDFDVAAKPQLSSPALDARRARLEQLRAARKALKAMEVARMEGEGGKPTGKVPLSDAELARRAYESSLKSRIADYKQLLAKGDFSPQPKKQPRTLTESELKLRREMEDVRHEVLQKYADYHLAHLKGIAWTADKVSEAAHLSRAIMTSFDLSALLRQGGIAALAHPALAKKALFETVASIARTFDSENAKALRGGINLENAKKFLATIDSRQAEFNLMAKLTEGPSGELRSKAGLNLPSSDQAITRQEEAFQGRWGKHVPGIALSSRLYTMILNKMRADLFDSMVQNLGRDGQVTMDEAKLIASFVNVATGRSDLKMFNRAAATLNTVFFAPRYVASRFQYLAMPFYLPFKGGLNQNWRAKRAVYQEFGRTAAGVATVLGAFALLGRLLFDDDDKDRPQVEMDPRSSDFMKVRIGDTRLDFVAGLSQVFVLSSRMALGQTKSSVTGKVRNFGEGFEPPTRMSIATQFARTKLAPVPGAIATIADDWTNVVGQKETPASMARSIVTPLSLEDVATVMKDQGIAKGTAMSILSTLGVGMNTYGPRTQYVTGTPEERQAQIEKDLKNMQWDSPELPAYSEFLTSEQLDKFRQRSREKKGLVVYQATYAGKDPDEIKTRDKNREHLDSMGVSKDEALQLLKDYYKSKEGGLRVKGETGLKDGYVRKLGALNSIYGK